VSEQRVSEYLAALAGELRMGARYRRRVLHELSMHLEDAVAAEQRRGLSPEEAERRALERLGELQAVADEFVAARRLWIASVQERAIRLAGYASAAVVVGCASLERLLTGDPDGHIGIELAVAIVSVVAILVIERAARARVCARATLLSVAGVWVTGTVLLISGGDVLFCLLVLGGVLGAGMLLYSARSIGRRVGRGTS
jgi:hypothetical protein